MKLETKREGKKKISTAVKKMKWVKEKQETPRRWEGEGRKKEKKKKGDRGSLMWTTVSRVRKTRKMGRRRACRGAGRKSDQYRRK